MAEPTITVHSIPRVVFTTSRPFDDVVNDIRTKLGHPHDSTQWQRFATGPDAAAITQSLDAAKGPGSEFVLFIEVPLSRLFVHFVSSDKFRPKMTQFTVGHPVTAAKLYEKSPRVGLMAPPRFVVVELPESKGSEVVFDLPSAVIGVENEEAGEIGLTVDEKLYALVKSVL